MPSRVQGLARLVLMFGLAVTLGHAGCSPGAAGKDANGDGAVTDSGAAVSDSGTGKADGTPADDSGVSDVQVPDTQAADTQTADTHPADAQKADTQTPDTLTADTQAADTVTTDVQKPDAAKPDAAAADGGCTDPDACPQPKDPCVVATCIKGTCGTAPREEGDACKSPDACVLSARCKSGACEAVKSVSCDDGDPCTVDACATTGVCTHKQGNVGAACDDDNPCTKGDTCKAGLGCVGGPAVCPCTTYEDCALKDDGDPCNGTLMCDPKSKTCVVNPTSVITCDTANDTACEQTVCNPKLGVCESKPAPSKTLCEDGNPCSLDEACDGLGNCVAGKNICACEKTSDCTSLEDGNLCNGTLFCDKTALPWTCAVNPATVVVCPDTKGQACLSNVCTPSTGTCAFSAVIDGKTCEDGDLCTKGDVCLKGACSSGTDVCGCTADSDCASQEDGDLCNGTLFCNQQTHACEVNPATQVYCPKNDPKSCQGWSCKKLTGKCVLGPVPDNAPCDDGSTCTVGETCAKGVCTPSATVCECKSNADCAKKEDGDLCNGTLYCDKQTGKCLVNDATKVTCPGSDDTACVKNTCDPKKGSCAPTPVKDNAPCDDGSACTLGDHCAKGECASGTNLCKCATDADCVNQDDGDVCNGTLFCNKTSGSCDLNPATVVVCPSVDDTTCNKNLCQPKTGKCALSPVNQGLGCDDGNPCTKSDSCLAGKCQPGTNTCECEKDADCAKQEVEPKNPCIAPLYCDTTGQKPKCAPNPDKDIKCSASSDTKCLKNLCNPKTGQCAMTPVNDKQVCAPGTLCAAVQICQSGQCKTGAPLSCNDGNPCTADSCDDFKGCQHKQTNAIQCDDGNKCTIEDLCVQGFCTGTTTDCNDESPCTQDLCAPLIGCQHFAKPGSCSDDDACTYGDVCKDKVCLPGKAVDCDDGNVCTADSCDPAKGCVGTPLQKVCTDGDACTKGDKCVSGVCFPGAADDCDDDNPCTDDSCDSTKGCAHDVIADGTECDDGDLCTNSDACSGGKCAASKTVCDDDNACSTDVCDPKTGSCVFSPVKDGGVCHVVGACLAGNCVDVKRGQVRVPAGRFAMGCNVAEDPYCGNVINEKPQHMVELDAYWVDLTEASVASYKACMKSGACAQPTAQGNGYFISASQSDDLPVNGLNYDESVAYCAWRGGRLPTEAEWEKAARGGCETVAGGDCAEGMPTWPAGTKPPPTCPDVIMRGADNKSGCGNDKPGPVGERPSNASPYGVLDMVGNVRELVSDLYDPNYYLASPLKNPKGPETGIYRVTRGGGWTDTASSLRAGRRSPLYASHSSSFRYVGVRCVRDTTPCDDANPCTLDKLSQGKCVHTANDGAACNDGDGCTVKDTCSAGACKPGAARDCDDGNPCTVDKCDVAKGGCLFTNQPLGTACAGDGKATCASGKCRWTDRNEVLIPGGTLAMGCKAKDYGCQADERPQHLVELSRYWMGVNEVTVAGYRACVNAGGCPDPATFSSKCEVGTGVTVEVADNWTYSDRELHPMNCVPHSAATAFCAWRGGRLPSEAEWEMAGRGSCAARPDAVCTEATPLMPWGNTMSNCTHQHTFKGGSNGAGCGTRTTTKVGNYLKDESIFGVRSLAGNVSEWTLDGYDSAYYGKSPKKDPVAPYIAGKTSRVARGGNLSSVRRLTDRVAYSDVVRRTGVGFRCVRPFNVCDDGDPCTTDTWDASAKKCVYTNAKAGTVCDDGDPCTTTDSCAGGACQAGPERDCADDDLCTTEACDSNSGKCISKPTVDGKVCTADGGKCVAGVCQRTEGGRARALVPKGLFYMGCNASVDTQCTSLEKPQHPVQISGFWMDTHEVTAGDYAKCVADGKCTTPSKSGSYCSSGARNTTQNAQWKRPVNCINHASAEAYCSWVKGRLPTEAEWEKAARGGCRALEGKACATLTMRRYPWGNEPASCTYAHMREGSKDGCGKLKLADVGSYPKGVSPYGLFDMAGNAREWVADSYSKYPSSGALRTDPKVVTSSVYRIVRGGDATRAASYVRTSRRDYASKSSPGWQTGVRCAYDYTACDDDNPCTVDKQDLKTGQCLHTASKDGLACNDGDICSELDSCKAGKCVGKPVVCDDSTPCTTEYCNKNTGGCNYSAAKDGTACGNAGSACVAGTCHRQDKSRVLVPPGTFYMGCNAAKKEACTSDEKPQHAVTLSRYWIDRTEVSAKDWRTCVAAGACTPPTTTGSSCKPESKSYTYGKKDLLDHPINCVSSDQAAAYCAFRGDRLPTEAEWEKAARGGCDRNKGASCAEAMRINPWGDAAAKCPTAHLSQNGVGGCGTGLPATVDGGASGASPYGVLRMAGNVSEMVSDLYASDAYANHDDTDPKGPSSGSFRVSRGAAYFAATSRAGDRAGQGTEPSLGLGFRCARDWDTCDDFNPCTVDAFDSKLGKCTHKNADKKACYDGDPCLTGDVCQGGKCVGGKVSRCDDGMPCTADTCDQTDGTCAFKPIKDGGACVGGGTCDAAGMCVHGLRNQVLVPAGTFWMGCVTGDTACQSDEKPQRLVTLSAYWIDRLPVTVDKYTSCVEAGACKKPNSLYADKPLATYGRVGYEHHPVNGVTWDRAVAYCSWSGGRLPTEAEWEKALRGGCETISDNCKFGTKRFPWGDAPPTCERSVIKTGKGDVDCKNSATRPAGSLTLGASPYGLRDMLGNVTNWVQDRYSATYFASAPSTDPKGPSSGSSRVIRGASFATKYTGVISSNRMFAGTGTQSTTRGFRCARDVAVCDDGNACTKDSVNSSTGSCSHSPLSSGACDDGNPCTVAGSCNKGSCTAGKAVSCDDGNSCTTDSCSTSTGQCKNKPVDNGQACGSSGAGCQLGACVAKTGGMTLVPAGDSWMGCNAGGTSCVTSSQPGHLVNVSKFYMDLYEVSVTDYAACVKASKCPAVNVFASSCKATDKQNNTLENRADHPVNCVTHTGAKSYCSWVGKRLPTEAEWEKAARGGCEVHPAGKCDTAPHYPWGGTPATCERAWYAAGGNGCGSNKTVKNESLYPGRSPYGARHMAGNVAEWVEDHYSLTYYANSPKNDPKGPASGSKRAARGGHWKTGPSNITVYRRYNWAPTQAKAVIGFRCARN